MPRVLLVDDAATIRHYFSTVLHHAGFEIDEAENGVEALEKALNGRFDLLLVDVNMPRMDGITFLRRLHDHQQTVQIPTVVATTEVSRSVMRDALATGAACVLRKPVDPERLTRIATRLTGAPQ